VRVRENERHARDYILIFPEARTDIHITCRGEVYNMATKVPIGKPLKNVPTIKELEKGFTFNWLEYASQKYVQISTGVSQSGTGGGNVYLVPARNDFFITNINLAGTGGGNCHILAQSGKSLLRMSSVAGGVNQASVVYPMPIRVFGGNAVQIEVAGAGANFDVIVTGFLVPWIA